jgi:hypothetical protein
MNRESTVFFLFYFPHFIFESFYYLFFLFVFVVCIVVCIKLFVLLIFVFCFNFLYHAIECTTVRSITYTSLRSKHKGPFHTHTLCTALLDCDRTHLGATERT